MTKQLKTQSSLAKFALMLLLLGLLSHNLLANTNLSGNDVSNIAISPALREIMSAEVNIEPIEPYLVFHNQEQAHAWLSDMSRRLARFVPDPQLRKYYLTIIEYEATRAKLDPQLILSIITVESRFRPYAVSSAGAEGLMQVMPQWKQVLGHRQQDLFDAHTNIRYGCIILSYYLHNEHGNLIRALERYNGSNGKVWYPQAIYHAYTTYWHPYPVMELQNGQLVAVNYVQ